MLIEITRPIFKCSHDEQVFMERLRAFGGKVKVSDAHQYLYLSLTEGHEQTALAQLQSVCDYWDTIYRVVDN